MTIPGESRIVALTAMHDGGFCASDEKGNLRFYSADGRLRSEQKFKNAIYKHIIQNEAVYVYDEENATICVFDTTGNKIKEIKNGNTYFNVLNDGRIIYKSDDSKSIQQITEDNVTSTFKTFGIEISFRPFITNDGNIALVLRNTPRVFLLLAPDGTEKCRQQLEGPNAWEPQRLPGNKLAIQSKTALNVIDTEQQELHAIPVNTAVTGYVCPIANDYIAYATGSGTIEIIAWNKKLQCAGNRMAKPTTCP